MVLSLVVPKVIFVSSLTYFYVALCYVQAPISFQRLKDSAHLRETLRKYELSSEGAAISLNESSPAAF